MDKISIFEGVFFSKISKYPLIYLDKHRRFVRVFLKNFYIFCAIKNDFPFLFDIQINISLYLFGVGEPEIQPMF